VNKPDYPLYALDIDSHEEVDGKGESKRIARIGCGGGGSGNPGIIGVPVYLFDVTRGHESIIKTTTDDDSKTNE
jgi:hypothetical protein